MVRPSGRSARMLTIRWRNGPVTTSGGGNGRWHVGQRCGRRNIGLSRSAVCVGDGAGKRVDRVALGGEFTDQRVVGSECVMNVPALDNAAQISLSVVDAERKHSGRIRNVSSSRN